MNQSVPPPKQPKPEPPKAPPGIAARGRDREFLPAALEILETPPSPLPVVLMLTICAFCAVALAWSFFGRLDVHAVAFGKIEELGRTKVIQPFDAGKVAALHVVNGEHVKMGDVLVELDPADAQADVTAASESLAAGRAEVQRRQAAIQAARPLQSGQAAQADAALGSPPPIPFSDDIPPAIRARERAVLFADFTQLQDALHNLDKQMVQKSATRKRLEGSIAYQDKLMRTLQGRVDMREKSIQLQVGTKVNLYDAKEAQEKSQAQLASDKGQLVETDAALDEISSQKIKAIAQFVADNESKGAEAARKADETAQQLAKARAKLARTILVSPVDGVAQQIAVTTIGQVVTTGQQLMHIVPTSRRLQVEAFVSNADIGFVKVGQPVEIKIDAFPFTRFGTVKGKVLRIATDAINEQDAKRAQSNALSLATSAGDTSNTPAGQQQSFVFPIDVELDSTKINANGVDIPLTNGMTVTAEIKTDSRRIIDYLLSPLNRITSEAMKER